MRIISVGSGGGERYEIVITTCGHCSGKGEVRCGFCDGKGQRRCGPCRGTGVEPGCGTCRGTMKDSCITCKGKRRVEAGDFPGSSLASPALVFALRQSVVLIEVPGHCVGSGFIVSGHGHIVTNAHVVEGASEVFAHWDPACEREPERLRILASGTAQGHDLALLLPENRRGSYEPLRLSHSYQQGAAVLVAGFPLSTTVSDQLGTRPADLVLTKGVLASVRKDDKGIVKYLQTDANAASGCSGGPLLVLEQGAVIAVITRAVTPTHEGGVGDVMQFAIPVDAVIECFESRITDR